MMNKKIPISNQSLPSAPPLRNLIGPSFIILAAGLGSGEVILWPYLASNFGLGIMWAAILGITFQFFLNMEIERYSLVTGESIFVGLTRRFGKLSPYWFMFTSFVPWIWPGIIASSAKVLAASLGIAYSGYIGIALLLLIGLFFSLGHVVYKTQETVQKLIIILGVPLIVGITLYLAQRNDWLTLLAGIVGRGETVNLETYWLIPAGIPFATFLAAFAYSGAGGNLNLAQSFYAKEKGYGMGKYFGKLTNIFSRKKSEIQLEGATFPQTPMNLKHFDGWWKKINLEHFLVFWLTGTISMLLLALLAYTTVFGHEGVETSINFVISEAAAISSITLPVVGTIFLVTAGLMLFGTQFSIYGSTSRIMTENLIITNPKRFTPKSVSKFFYFFLWLQILAGISVFALGFTEPLTLVVLGAVLNAISMFIYTGMVLFLNATLLPVKTRPNLLRKFALLVAFLFYGSFSIFTVVNFLL